MEAAKKGGILFDPDMGGGIPTTSTDIQPYYPDGLKDNLGLRPGKNTNFVDIDISGLKVNRLETGAGWPEIRIMESVEADRILDWGKVLKSMPEDW